MTKEKNISTKHETLKKMELQPGALNGLAKLRVDIDLLPFIIHFVLVDGH
jgi:hypothetical protein